MDTDRGILLGAQAARQQVGLRMDVGLFLGDLAFVDEPLHEGVVHRAELHVRTAEVVDPGVARMQHIGRQIRVDDEGREGAVRLFFEGDGRELDHEVGLMQQLGEDGRPFVLRRHIAVEDLARREHHLIGRLATATLAPHAICHHGHHAAGCTGVGQHADLVLLVGPVSAVDACGRHQAETGWCSNHGENYNL